MDDDLKRRLRDEYWRGMAGLYAPAGTREGWGLSLSWQGSRDSWAEMLVRG